MCFQENISKWPDLKDLQVINHNKGSISGSYTTTVLLANTVILNLIHTIVRPVILWIKNKS